MSHHWYLRTDRGQAVVVDAALKSSAVVWARHQGHLDGNIVESRRLSERELQLWLGYSGLHFEAHWDPQTSEPLATAPRPLTMAEILPLSPGPSVVGAGGRMGRALP
jgi:hypothetical protein